MDINQRTVQQRQGVKADPVYTAGELEWRKHQYKLVKGRKPKKPGRWY